MNHVNDISHTFFIYSYFSIVISRHFYPKFMLAVSLVPRFLHDEQMQNCCAKNWSVKEFQTNRALFSVDSPGDFLGGKRIKISRVFNVSSIS